MYKYYIIYYINKGYTGVLELLELTCPTTCACLFKLRPGVLSRDLSHIWGTLNLPMFLFNVGLLTLMNMDSLISLAKLCPSLPIIWNILWLVGWPVWLLCWWMGEVSSRHSLFLWPKVLEVPLCIHHHKRGHHIGTNKWPHFGWPWGLCPWGRLVSFLWYYYLWSRSVCHIYHRSSWYFHRDLVCRV